MSLSIRQLEPDRQLKPLKERSYLEWKVNLPFMWIDAVAANDALEKENLLREAIGRNDEKLRSVPAL